MGQFKGSAVHYTGGRGSIVSNRAIHLVEPGGKAHLADSLIPDYGRSIGYIAPITDQVIVNTFDARDIIAMRYLIQGHDFLLNLVGQTSHIDSMENTYCDPEITDAKAPIDIAAVDCLLARGA